jgi:hypothetical protein
MQTVVWQRVGDGSDHPFGSRSEATTKTLSGIAKQAPTDPA